MKIKHQLLNFMYKCLLYEDVVISWGMKQIQIYDSHVSFYVNGFNYQGEIVILVEDDKLVLNSTNEYIGSSNNSEEAIKILDIYIESNESKYRKLYDFIFQ